MQSLANQDHEYRTWFKCARTASESRSCIVISCADLEIGALAMLTLAEANQAIAAALTTAQRMIGNRGDRM